MRIVDGYLSEREARCLMAAVAVAPALGANVEIGSFKGRSTIGISYISKRFGRGRTVAIDPHTSPSTTDPDLRGESSSLWEFSRNLKNANLFEDIDLRVGYSQAVAREWSEPIRVLWIDGDHTYAGARADVSLFKPYLAPGALLLMHDVLGTHYGSLRVFVEEVLGSNDFGPAGYSGSIGWAQYRGPGGDKIKYRLARRLLAIPARQIMPVAQSPRGLAGWNKLRYKIWRPLAPHGLVTPRRLWEKIR